MRMTEICSLRQPYLLVDTTAAIRAVVIFFVNNQENYDVWLVSTQKGMR